MLHERTVPLRDHDAVAVRTVDGGESETLVLYAERLSAAQRAALRRHLLEALAEEPGPAATVTVPAGATGTVLAREGRGVAPLSPAGAVLFTFAAALVVAALVAAVAVLIVHVPGGYWAEDMQRPDPLTVADKRPSVDDPAEVVPDVAEEGVVDGSPSVPAVDDAPAELAEGHLRLPPELPVGAPAAVGQVVSPAPGPAVPGRATPTEVAEPPSLSARTEPEAPASDQPPDVQDGLADLPAVEAPADLPDIGLPEVDLPDVEVPEVPLPLPDVDVELPDVEVPDVELPDVRDDENEDSEDDGQTSSPSDEEGEEAEPDDEGESDE